MSDTPTLTDEQSRAVDPIGAEWERVTRAVLAIHYDWSKRELRAINDFILTVRYSIADVPPAPRCGAVIAALGWQCTKLSDHDGRHDFSAAPQRGT